MSEEQEDYDAACYQQEAEERAQWEAERAKHKQFRAECETFEREFEVDNKRIFSTAQAVNEQEIKSCL